MNKFFVSIALGALLTVSSLSYADNVLVKNMTNTRLYFAIYLKPKIGNAALERLTNVKTVQQNNHKLVERPSISFRKKITHDRKLVAAREPGFLKPTLTKNQYNTLASQGVGQLQGDVFYLALNQSGRLSAYNLAGWGIAQAQGALGSAVTQATDAALEPLRAKIKRDQPAIKNNPYKGRQARVRKGPALAQQEQAVINARMPKIKQSLESLLETSLDGKYIPKIAFIASGGGYRAMTCTMGFLSGAQKSGLLDSVLWGVGLSGSTWALGLWMSSGKPLGDFQRSLFAKMRQHIKYASKDQMHKIFDQVLVKWAYGQQNTLVDMYGGLLANRLLSDFRNPHMVRMSGQHEAIKNGDRPFPIYTAITGEVSMRPEWYEFTPYEVGLPWMNAYIPTWAYGRKFENGVSVDNAPEQSLGYLLGTFGSAFAAQIKDIYADIADGMDMGILEPAIQAVMKDIGNKRLTSAIVFNFVRGLNASSFAAREKMKLVDAGLDFNLPYPPVSGEYGRRKADILIFWDASKTIAGAPALKGARDYARRRGLKFPEITDEQMSKLNTKSIWVFKDDNDSSVPVVIYMPRIKDKAQWNALSGDPAYAKYKQYLDGFDPEQCVQSGFCATKNFEYTLEQARQQAVLMQFNMVANHNEIMNAIRGVISAKTPQETPQATLEPVPVTPLPQPVDSSRFKKPPVPGPIDERPPSSPLM